MMDEGAFSAKARAALRMVSGLTQVMPSAHSGVVSRTRSERSSTPNTHFSQKSWS